MASREKKSRKHTDSGSSTLIPPSYASVFISRRRNILSLRQKPAGRSNLRPPPPWSRAQGQLISLSVSVWTRRTSGLRHETLLILGTIRATRIQPESDSLVSEDDEEDDEEEESEEELLALRRDGWAWTSDAGLSSGGEKLKVKSGRIYERNAQFYVKLSEGFTFGFLRLLPRVQLTADVHQPSL